MEETVLLSIDFKRNEVSRVEIVAHGLIILVDNLELKLGFAHHWQTPGALDDKVKKH